MNAVMVVEDEQLIAKDIADTLTTMGYAVTGTVASGEECMEAASVRRPDLVLMDINLGGEMDGIKAAQLLRERFDVPVVFLSAYADDRTLRRAKLTSPLGYLLKPFRKSELKSAVEVGLFRHKLERQLRARERWFSTTLRAIGDAVIAVDSQSKVAFMNGPAEAVLGRSEASVKGQAFSSVVQLVNERTREPIADPVALALERREIIHIPPHSSLLSERGELPVEDSVAPIVDGDELLGAVVVMRDVSEQRRAQQQMAVADRLSALGAVAAGVAHEINNPLTYIVGNLGFARETLDRLRHLTRDLPADDRAAQIEDALAQLDELVHDMDDGATRVNRIVSDLGFFARRRSESGRGAPLRALEWALRVSRAAITPHAKLTVRLSPVPDVACDDGSLGQIFLNLLINASHALSGGDAETNELIVTTELEPPSEGGAPGWVRVTVQDTGSGMTVDVLDHIFDPFFTTKPVGMGTGLGLSVCHGLVEDCGGTIRATSAPGAGSTFVVRLPLATAATPPFRTEHPAAPAKSRVLVVDAEPRVSSVIERLLSPLYEVVTCDSAKAALELVAESAAFDAILCDLHLPELDGTDFHAAVQRERPALARRIIFLSGAARTDRTAQFFRSVPNRLLQKPPSAAELIEAVERQLRALRSPPAEAGPRAASTP